MRRAITSAPARSSSRTAITTSSTRSSRISGLSAWAVASAPTVKTHDLDIPRIGYVHSWTRTQDEGWVRAALDTYGVPYTYFADQKLRDGNLRAKYDVIIFPHVGGTAQSQVAGTPKTGTLPLPYKKTDATPNLGYMDQSDDIRGGMGIEGLMNLYKFVEEGGTLITEGSTATIFPEYNLTTGVTVETPTELFARGSILRGIISDKKSPLVYGYEGTQLPVYFNQSPVLNAGGTGNAAALAGGRGGAPGLSQNVTPNATPLKLSPWDSSAAALEAQLAPATVDVVAAAAAVAVVVVAVAAVVAVSEHSARRRRIRFVRASSCSSRRTRTTCCSPARSRVARRSPTARSSWMRRSARDTS